MIRILSLIGSLSILSCVCGAEAIPPETISLKAGSKAPALAPEKWLKGEPVAAFEPGKVYLVECWATWCGPCVAAIPHLNEVHNRLKDEGLVVIGVNVMEDAEEKAAAFVARKGDRMAYRVAYDGKGGNIATDWLKAAGARGIPHAFLVRDGSILWHGQPLELNAENLRRVLQGGTILAKAAREQGGPDDGVIAYRRARLEILALLQQREVDKALERIDAAQDLLSSELAADPDVLRGMAYSVRGDRDRSLAHYEKAVKAADGGALGLFRVALGLLDSGSVRDPGLALRCARGAAAKDDNPVVRHLLARAESAAGNKAAAVAILEKLVEEEDDETYREELRRLLQNGPQPAGAGNEKPPSE